MKLLIADDHAIIRRGLIQILNEEYKEASIFEAANRAEVFDNINKSVFDLIILDISMPESDGVEILKQLRSNGVKSPILILSMYPENQYALRALRAGASGYLNKASASEELLIAVKKLLSGKKYLTVNIAEKLAESIDTNHKGDLHESLSDREIQVFLLIASGKTVSEIAKQISLSVNTVSTYRTRILEKLSLQNNAEITRYAIDYGMI